MNHIIYTEPVLTSAEIKDLNCDIEKWINYNGFMKIPKLFHGLVMENARLTKEVNELRAMLEIPARPVYYLNERKS